MKKVDWGRRGIWLALGAALLLGLWLLPDYGASWDEPNLRAYGAAALQAYSPDARAVPGFDLSQTYGPTNHRYYGPAFVMAARLLVDALRANPFGWEADALWHLANFLSFLGGAYALWTLCRRIARPGAALAATLLYLSQPLLWGHAFINSKDVPFLSALTVAVAVGFHLVDVLQSPSIAGKRPGRGGGGLPSSARCLLLGGAGLVSLACLLGVLSPALRALAELVFESAAASPDSPLGRLYFGLAASAAVIPPAEYAAKLMRWVGRAALGSAAAGAAGLGLGGLLSGRAALADWLKDSLAALRSPRAIAWLLLAALSLGLATSIRLLGPLAGVLVALYALARLRWRALLPLGLYALLALPVCYAAWPYLWLNPLGNFREALAVMSSFPDPFQVRFNGIFYVSQQLPPQFLWGMFGVTLTLPALALILGGTLLSGLRLARGKGGWVSALLLTWFLLPLAAWMIWRPPLYDNGRQYLFVLPPAFALAGPAFEALFGFLQTRLKVRGWRARAAGGLLLGLALLPGIAAGARLHPYQYAYYNALTGGQAGAFRRYEVDYWLTSYKEAAAYLNANAPKGAKIALFGSVELLKLYADPSFEIRKYQAGDDFSADYALLSSRSDIDLSLFPDAPVVFSVGRGGAVYAVVKKIGE